MAGRVEKKGRTVALIADIVGGAVCTVWIGTLGAGVVYYDGMGGWTLG